MANKQTYTIHFVGLGNDDTEFPSTERLQQILMARFDWLMVDVIKDD